MARLGPPDRLPDLGLASPSQLNCQARRPCIKLCCSPRRLNHLPSTSLSVTTPSQPTCRGNWIARPTPLYLRLPPHRPIPTMPRLHLPSTPYRPTQAMQPTSVRPISALPSRSRSHSPPSRSSWRFPRCDESPSLLADPPASHP
jgi:hypothetical protein